MSPDAINVQGNELASWDDLLTLMTDRQPLNEQRMRAAMNQMMAGAWDETQIVSFLAGLRKKGETGEEIAAAAAVLRENMVRVDVGPGEALDTCGTGGDGSGTFNISTAAALVAAGAGVPVVKHGNCASSGRTGSADVLAALGVQFGTDSSWAKNCLEQAGFAFCFAPHFHPAMRHVASARKKLGFRTIFNCLGPLANPAGACYQLVGVGHQDWLDPMARALNCLGTRRALLVHAEDGLDEVSLSAPTLVREVQNGQVSSWVWTESDFDLPACSKEEIISVDVSDSAARILDILEGEDSPSAHVVLANASAALIAAGRVKSPPEGVEMARTAITSRKALAVLERLRACSQRAN
jgi:anthranilate phosphoribosyltransferase